MPLCRSLPLQRTRRCRYPPRGQRKDGGHLQGRGIELATAHADHLGLVVPWVVGLPPDQRRVTPHRNHQFATQAKPRTPPPRRVQRGAPPLSPPGPMGGRRSVDPPWVGSDWSEREARSSERLDPVEPRRRSTTTTTRMATAITPKIQSQTLIAHSLHQPARSAGDSASVSGRCASRPALASSCPPSSRGCAPFAARPRSAAGLWPPVGRTPGRRSLDPGTGSHARGAAWNLVCIIAPRPGCSPGARGGGMTTSRRGRYLRGGAGGASTRGRIRWPPTMTQISQALTRAQQAKAGMTRQVR
jgi:hypothetical protein